MDAGGDGEEGVRSGMVGVVRRVEVEAEEYATGGCEGEGEGEGGGKNEGGQVGDSGDGGSLPLGREARRAGGGDGVLGSGGVVDPGSPVEVGVRPRGAAVKEDGVSGRICVGGQSGKEQGQRGGDEGQMDFHGKKWKF